jgi:serine protease AprX
VPANVVDVLAARPDVEQVWPDEEVGPVMDVSHQAIEAPRVWESSVDGDSVTVAVIDTGIDAAHPWFEDAVVGCLSMIAGIESPECFDLDGHGTHVAGTVASRDPEFRGVAPATKLVSIRTLHGQVGLSSDSIAGMEWIQENKDTVDPPIQVATMSLGPLDPGCGDGTDPSSEAANALVASGVSFTIAAGNSGHDECTIDGAASATDVVTVGGVNDRGTVTQDDDTIYEDSSGGPTADGRLKPDVVFPAVEITSSYPYAQGFLILTATGTSMATPHAAGTAALLLDDDPSLAPAEVKDRITRTAYAPANGAAGDLPNNVWGHGSGNACRALMLATCTVPFAPQTSVATVGTQSEHTGGRANGRHEISVSATIVDEVRERLAGAEVTFSLVDPDGDEQTGTATSNSAGVAFVTIHEPRGHGTWAACVTDVAADGRDYAPDANWETCESFEVT